jgi:hypothetical protein
MTEANPKKQLIGILRANWDEGEQRNRLALNYLPANKLFILSHCEGEDFPSGNRQISFTMSELDKLGESVRCLKKVAHELQQSKDVDTLSTLLRVLDISNEEEDETLPKK